MVRVGGPRRAWDRSGAPRFRTGRVEWHGRRDGIAGAYSASVTRGPPMDRTPDTILIEWQAAIDACRDPIPCAALERRLEVLRIEHDDALLARGGIRSHWPGRFFPTAVAGPTP